MRNRNKNQVIAIFLIAFFLLGTGVFSALGQAANNNSNPEVEALNKKIREKREQAKALEEKQKQFELELAKTQNDKLDLANQIAILDNHLAKAQLELDAIKLDIDQTDMEIRKLGIEIQDKQDVIDKQKEHLASVIRVLYKQGQASSLEILLLNNSFSEFLNQVKYLGDINGDLAKSMSDLNDLKTSLEKDKASHESKLAELQQLKTKFDEKLARLQADKESKTIILDQIITSEAQYQNLIQASKAEQAQASTEISSIERQVRQKLSLAQSRDGQKQELQLNPNGFVWPVNKNVVTAYFHDPDYPFRYIFEHPAIDIRAAQGSKVKAVADGYVARAKDSGMGYSYIMIVHGDGLATVYGHISRILVKEDEFVTQGQIIGLSGGTPGTPGAGRLTSGPHMHFEVRLNGIPVNPLEYLN